MKKEGKISVTHFDNMRLKKKILDNIEYYPLYIRIVYNRKKITLPSILFTDFIEKEIKYDAEKIQLLKEKELHVIDEIIKLVIQENKEFDFLVFKKYYRWYSKNIFEIMEEFFFQKGIEKLKRLKQDTLSSLLWSNRINLDTEIIFKIIKELKQITSINNNRIDEIDLEYYFAFFNDLFFYISRIVSRPLSYVLSKEYDIRYEVKLAPIKNVYFSIIEWNNKFHSLEMYTNDIHRTHNYDEKINKEVILTLLKEFNRKLMFR